MEKKIIASIHEKELQLSKLSQHIEKSDICSDLYNKVLLEKAILKKQLDDLRKNSILNKIKHLLPHKEKLICDYFKG